MASRSSPCTFSRFFTKNGSAGCAAKNASVCGLACRSDSTASRMASRCVTENAATPSVSAGVSRAWRSTASATAFASSALTWPTKRPSTRTSDNPSAPERGFGEGSTSSRPP